MRQFLPAILIAKLANVEQMYLEQKGHIDQSQLELSRITIPSSNGATLLL